MSDSHVVEIMEEPFNVTDIAYTILVVSHLIACHVYMYRHVCVCVSVLYSLICNDTTCTNFSTHVKINFIDEAYALT